MSLLVQFFREGVLRAAGHYHAALELLYADDERRGELLLELGHAALSYRESLMETPIAHRDGRQDGL